MLTYARLAAVRRAGAKTRARCRVERGRLTEGRRRQEGVKMRTGSRRSGGYRGVVSSLTAVMIISL